MPCLGPFFGKKLMPKGKKHSYLSLLSTPIRIKVFTCLHNPSKVGKLHCPNVATAYSESDLILIKARIATHTLLLWKKSFLESTDFLLYFLFSPTAP